MGRYGLLLVVVVRTISLEYLAKDITILVYFILLHHWQYTDFNLKTKKAYRNHLAKVCCGRIFQLISWLSSYICKLYESRNPDIIMKICIIIEPLNSR